MQRLQPRGIVLPVFAIGCLLVSGTSDAGIDSLIVPCTAIEWKNGDIH